MVEETPLCKLAFKYGSDKCLRLKKHSYTNYYYELLKNKRSKVKKVLEIGIGGGASLRMWRDFFPEAQIYGAEYVPGRLFTEKRIETFLCDQRRGDHLSNLIAKIGSDIDVVIEDASHRPRDQVFTCLRLMPLLSPKTIYVIEDVADPSIVNRLQDHDLDIPKLTHINRYDNMLVVVRHKKQTPITIFAKSPYRVGSDRHLARVSSIIRGQQICEKLGAKLNPDSGYKNDVCIYVKPPYKPGQDFKFEGKKAYLDMVDEMAFVNLLKKHPEVGVITLSQWNWKLLKKLVPNKVINIPQQHCNFENVQRLRKDIKRVGIIGTYKAFDYLPHGLKEELAKRGLELVCFSKFSARQDIINFYLNIDVQIVWRPYLQYKQNILANPLKIVNAASFGVPTIAFDEPAFWETKGCYIPVHTLEEFLQKLDQLRSKPSLYKRYVQNGLKLAEKYHIEKIAKLYKNLAHN